MTLEILPAADPSPLRSSSTFRNPVLPGFHPDPSICKMVGGGYLLAVSSFEYFPGIPLFTSDDLVSWTPIGHVFDRAEQLNLTGVEFSDGLWAPTVRQHEGTYFLVVTLCRDRRGSATYLATATDPEGPWSQPIQLDSDGIDPSLFFDDDGRCWFTACRDSTSEGNPAELWSQELDLRTLSLVGPQYSLWGGALSGAWAEGPHLHKHDGTYYLIAAEGGTGRDHAVTLASAPTATGPYRGLPNNPLLTHRHLGAEHPIQNVGHADLIETDDGETWAVLLAVRPEAGHHVLGREVFLVPVTWEREGPVFAPGTGQAQLIERRPSTLSPSRPAVAQSGSWTSPIWSTLRHDDSRSGVKRCEDKLVLDLLPGGPDGRAPQALLVRRQEHHRFSASVTVDFNPLNGGEAGLIVLQHRLAYATISIQTRAKTRVAVTRHQGPAPFDAVIALGADTAQVTLKVEATDGEYVFSMTELPSGKQTTFLTPVPIWCLSTETAGGFTGVHVGPYATARGDVSDAQAVFTDFHYDGRSA